MSISGIRQFGLRFLIFAAVALSGCAAPRLQPEQLNLIRNVGVLSFLPADLRYAKVGVTVFNNESRSQPVGDELNEAARAAAEKALIRVPGRTVLQLRDGVPALSARYYARSLVMSDSTERIQDALARLATENGLDAIFVVGEVFDSDQGRAGVRVLFRAGAGDIRHAAILPDVAVHVVDRNGKILARDYSQSGQWPVKRSDDRPWEYRLEMNLDSSTRAKVLSDMRRAIGDSVAAKIDRLGF